MPEASPHTMWEARAHRFLAAVGDTTTQAWEGEPSLIEQLAACLQEAKEAWPTLTRSVRSDRSDRSAGIDDDAFIDYLTARIAAEQTRQGGSWQELLPTLRSADLYLACACFAGDSKAIAAFEDAFFKPVFGIVTKRLNVAPSRFEEVKQATHKKLFVAEAGEVPKIASYNGQGKLFRWAEVVFTRAAMKFIVRKDTKEVQLEEQVMDRLSAHNPNPELHYLKTTYRAHFKATFAEAMEALSAKERNTLRYFYIDGLNIDKIGLIHNVHRATVARWLNQIREKLFRDTRERLQKRMQISEDEVESILGLIQSQLDLSMRLFFAPEGKGDEEPR